MTSTTKDVTGVICLPLPAQNRGRHTLSTIYRDGKYNQKTKCFEIQVVSATPVINAGDGEDGRPNTTVHFVVEVTNEKGLPVKDGQVKMYYNSEQSNAWAQDALEEQGVNVEIDGANIVNTGRVTLDYQIPSNFRAGIVQLRFRYDLSHEGYDDASIVVPVYVFFDGNLQVSFKHGTVSDNLTPVDEYNNVPIGDKLYCTATLYDGTGSNKVPMADIPINFKMNTGTLDNKNTNSSGVCTVSTPVINSLDSFIIKIKNEAKRFLGSNEVTTTFNPARHIVLDDLVLTTKSAHNGASMKLTVEVTVKDELDNALQGRPVLVKLNDISAPNNGDFASPDDTKIVNTDSEGEAVLTWNSISLSHDTNYMVEVVVGGNTHLIGLDKELGNIKWVSNTERLYEMNSNGQLTYLMST